MQVIFVFPSDDALKILLLVKSTAEKKSEMFKPFIKFK